MGCGESKGKSSEGSGADAIKFKTTGVYDLDQFFNRCTDLVESFKGITDPVRQEKEKFFEESGFVFVCGASRYSP